MSIVDKIRRSVEKATELHCLYQSAEQLNRIADNTDFPAALFVLLTQGQIASIKPLRERVTVAMFFVDKTEFDFQAAENEHIIEGCQKKAHKWIKSLIGSHELRIVAVESTERVYDYLDVQLTGYAVRVTLEEITGIC